MPEAETASRAAGRPGRLARLGRSLSFRLAILLVGAMVVVFAVLGYNNVRLHRQELETATLQSAERISDIIERSANYCMLRNDREGLYQIMRTIGGEPGMVRIRIFNQEGHISVSTDEPEVGHNVDKNAEACYACHSQAEPLSKLDRPDRFRIYRLAGGERVLGVINPVENQPSCSNADCHAHPPGQKILGVIDASLSLASADAALAAGTRNMIVDTLLALVLISTLAALLVWLMVYGPISALKKGTVRLAGGDLGYQIDVRSGDEIGELASSFNAMSRDLKGAREEVTSWARTLEARVEEKTRELQRAQEHYVQVEKMASVGRLAATVAHEINNPLSGILTYSKLLLKWLDRGEIDSRYRDEARSSLQLIQSESRRCGDIVKNLLVFARAAPMNLEWADLNTVVDRCTNLVAHKMELSGVQLQVQLDQGLPPVHCDPAQVEQVLVALVVNAIEAMPRGGNLAIRSRAVPGTAEVEIDVQDDGPGIPPEMMANIFEPFFTTKEIGRGVGLGLAIGRSIVERHGGRIGVVSDPGRGTTFTVTLPVDGKTPAPVPAGAGASAIAKR